MKSVRTLSVCALCATLLFVSGCTPPPDSTDISDEIVSRNGEFVTAWNKGDAAGVAAIYTSDGTFMAPNAPTVTGPSNIQATIQSFMDAGVKTIALEGTEIRRSGDIAYEVGKYNLFADGGTEIDDGKYIVLWKNVDGIWMYHRDIFNSNRPIPQPESEVDTEMETDDKAEEEDAS